jgi:hypothetical protein
MDVLGSGGIVPCIFNLHNRWTFGSMSFETGTAPLVRRLRAGLGASLGSLDYRIIHPLPEINPYYTFKVYWLVSLKL